MRAENFVRPQIQMILKSLDVETQEALIIKIAHKTVNNKMLMMPLLLLPFVNSNCYCGHLVDEKEKEEFN